MLGKKEKCVAHDICWFVEMTPSAAAGGTVITDNGGAAWLHTMTHNILAINHSRTGPHTIILLTTTSSRLATASINAQTHLRWVFGSTAPADAPTAEHPGLCLGYTFIK